MTGGGTKDALPPVAVFGYKYLPYTAVKPSKTR